MSQPIVAVVGGDNQMFYAHTTHNTIKSSYRRYDSFKSPLFLHLVIIVHFGVTLHLTP
jgi:hypothetical protein